MAGSSESKPIALIIGASRGIGRQIALTLASANYTVVLSSKSTSDASTCSPFPPDPNSNASTISTVAREIHLAGGSALPIPCDVRSEASINALVSAVAARFGRVDALIYNAGAIWWGALETTPTKRFRLMHEVNAAGLYVTLQACFSVWAAQTPSPWQCRVVVVSPPIYSRFFRGKAAYAAGKVGMSVLVRGLAMDWARVGGGRRAGMSVTGLWPAVAVESAATQGLEAGKSVEEVERGRRDLRKATVFADAVLAILESEVGEVSGRLLLDEDFLREKGVVDFDKYSLVPGSKPRRIMPAKLPTLEVDEQDDEGTRIDSAVRRAKL